MFFLSPNCLVASDYFLITVFSIANWSAIVNTFLQ
nr:MAG TPA: hypothetical protein [Caudoviricetes sp.]